MKNLIKRFSNRENQQGYCRKKYGMLLLTMLMLFSASTLKAQVLLGTDVTWLHSTAASAIPNLPTPLSTCTSP